MKKQKKISLNFCTILIIIVAAIFFGWVMSFLHLEIRTLAIDYPMRNHAGIDEFNLISQNITEGALTETEKVQLLVEFTNKVSVHPERPPMQNNPNAWYILDGSRERFHIPCGQTAILLAALAKGSDLQTRIIGLEGYHHILTETKIDGKWVLVDPLKLGCSNENENCYYFEKEGKLLSAYELVANQDAIPNSAVYRDNYFDQIYFDTYNSKNQYFTPNYLYGREWIDVDIRNGESPDKLYSGNYSGISYARVLFVAPLFLRFTFVMRNVPIVLHYDIFLLIGLLALIIFQKYVKIKSKKLAILSICFTVIYFAAEIVFWRLYYTGAI